MMQSNLTEVVEKQSLIISIQAGVINDLFGLLGQYMATEELDALPVVARINTAAEIRAEID
jgi:hypothetical protein